MTIPYGVGDKAEVFRFSLFLVFCNRVVAATIAAITLVVSGLFQPPSCTWHRSSC